MSRKTATSTASNLPDQERPDDTEPTLERQKGLRAAVEDNIRRGDPPYAGVFIHTLGELIWIVREWQDHQPLLNPKPVNLSHALLFGVNLSHANLAGIDFSEAELQSADLSGAQLIATTLTGAGLAQADLTHARLRGAALDGAVMLDADLRSADLRDARMNVSTNLNGVKLDSSTLLADVLWNGASLMQVNWEEIPMLGDETAVRTANENWGEMKVEGVRTSWYEAAVRANRQVATALRGQGMNEHADRFAYRAQLCQRVVLRLQAFTRVEGQTHSPLRRVRKFSSYLGSWFLWLIAGYGYRPLWSFATYLLVVTLFGLTYWVLGIQTGHMLTWNEAGVVSVTAFHGRGFFATAFQPGDPQAAVAAVEAIFGLLIEITFIATFTQRFFAR